MRLTELGAKVGMNYPAVYEAVRGIDKQLPEKKQLKQTMNRIKQILTF
jgi:hypothetical protein